MNTFTRTYLVVISITVIILLCLLILIRDIPSEVIVAFLGVLVGSIITSFFQYLMTEAKMMQQWRLAALDKRLQIAQEAYSFWRQLRTLPANEKADKIITDCQQWWENHNLYLAPEPRKAFRDGYVEAQNLAQAREQQDTEGIKISIENIERVGRIIEESVFLPSVGKSDLNKNKSDP